MDFFISNAHAQAAGGGNESLLSLLPLVLIFVVFYFLLIRPQSKRQKEHRDMVSNLQKGDEVTTAGGLLGKITEVKDNFVKLEEEAPPGNTDDLDMKLKNHLKRLADKLNPKRGNQKRVNL